MLNITRLGNGNFAIVNENGKVLKVTKNKEYAAELVAAGNDQGSSYHGWAMRELSPTQKKKVVTKKIVLTHRPQIKRRIIIIKKKIRPQARRRVTRRKTQNNGFMDFFSGFGFSGGGRNRKNDYNDDFSRLI